ncbi:MULTISPECIES: WXG100 family type VII secretion target [unclassified Streptomyces]|uniref:WXG100 family type VII secretion target n=1 Tax=unclassified Streptomyces TaxID=2593676 RepID=UPI00278C7C2F|nr:MULTISPECIES: WXG100 family type VII secretion target [unclassified Streptomyces]
MSDDESVAEKVYEAGMDIVNPGGDPEALENAARAWRRMHDDVQAMFGDLDREVSRAVGETWRGDSADAFHAHWRELHKVVEEVLPDFKNAAEGLDEAADNIRKVNEEIHEIYLEIGISVAVSVASSFITMGFSAAAGAARAAQLAARAVAAAGRLGRALKAIAGVFRALYTSQKAFGAGKVALDGLANFAGGTAGGVATSLLSGKGPEWQTNLVGGAAGATVGTVAGSAVGAVAGKGVLGDFAGGVAGGAAGGFTGDYLDSVRKGEDFDPKAAAITAVTGGAAGGAAGVSVGMQTAFTPHITPGQELSVDVGTNSVAPVVGGVVANESKDSLEEEEKEGGEAGVAAAKTEKGVQSGKPQGGGSAGNGIRSVFG